MRLVEAQVGPHDKVCGEFLSFEAELYLAELGVNPIALGATEIHDVALWHGARRASARLPFRALSLSRRVMDEALLLAAARAGAVVLRGRRAAGVEPVGAGWRVRLDDGQTIDAMRVVLATGKHDLRGYPRPPGRQTDLIGFKQRWRLAAEARDLGGVVELHLFPGGYAGLQSSGPDGMANLCLAVRRRSFAAAGKTWNGLMTTLMGTCPGLARRARGAEPETDKPLAIGAIPYGHVQRRADGLWRIGDQAAVIPSFAGEGMAIALHSARMAAEVILRGGSAGCFHRSLAQDVGRQIGRATWLSRALVLPTGQALTGSAARLVPASLAFVGRTTRIRREALRTGGEAGSVGQRPERIAGTAALGGGPGDPGQAGTGGPAPREAVLPP